MNASEAPHRLRVTVEGLEGIRLASPQVYEVEPASNRAVPISVQIPPGVGTPGSNPIRFVVEAIDDPSLARSERAAFMVPR